jgi:hypothetical protein
LPLSLQPSEAGADAARVTIDVSSTAATVPPLAPPPLFDRVRSSGSAAKLTVRVLVAFVETTGSIGRSRSVAPDAAPRGGSGFGLVIGIRGARGGGACCAPSSPSSIPSGGTSLDSAGCLAQSTWLQLRAHDSEKGLPS